MHGYVTSAAAEGKGAGVYVALSATQTARVKLRALSDEFVDDPSAAFPPGKHVSGHVVDVAGGRIEMSLKSANSGSGNWHTIESLEIGQEVRGTVKRVEAFGVFVSIADSALQGLVHVSELSDSYVKDAADKARPGQPVRAVVLRKDVQQGRVSLGMKASYFTDGGSGSDDNAGGRGATGGVASGHVQADVIEEQDAGDVEMDLEDAMAAAFDESDSDDESAGDESDDGGQEDAGVEDSVGAVSESDEERATRAVLRHAHAGGASATANIASESDGENAAAPAAPAAVASSSDDDAHDADATQPALASTKQGAEVVLALEQPQRQSAAPTTHRCDLTLYAL